MVDRTLYLHKNTPTLNDIIICGAGFTGLILAASINSLGLRTIILEKKSSSERKRYGSRYWFLNASTVRYIKSLGIDITSSVLCYVRDVHVYEKKKNVVELDLSSTFISFDMSSFECKKNIMGCMVREDLLTQCLYSFVREKNIRVLHGENIIDTYLLGDLRYVKTEKSEYSAMLVLAADGLFSIMRILENIHVYTFDHSACIMVNVKTHGKTSFSQTASQIFTKDGPVGLLPIGQGMFHVVWSCDNSNVIFKDKEKLWGVLKNLIEKLFKCDISLVEDTLYLYPIRSLWSQESVKDRMVLVGNARYSFHPLGGQQANCIVEDISCLMDFLRRDINKNGAWMYSSHYLKKYSTKQSIKQFARFLTFEGIHSVHKINRLYRARSIIRFIIQNNTSLKSNIIRLVV